MTSAPPGPRPLTRRLRGVASAARRAWRDQAGVVASPVPAPVAPTPTPPPPTASAPPSDPTATARAVETVTAPHSPVAPLQMRVGIAAGPRLRALLDPEWQLLDLDRRTAATALDGGPLDLVLLEGVAGSVIGWGDAAALAGLLDALAATGTPVALWVTDDVVPSGGWLERVDAVGATSAAMRDAVAGATGRDVHLWAPAAQPRSAGLAREDATTTRRSGVLTVVDDLSRLTDDSGLRVVVDAIGRLPAAQTPLLRITGRSSAVTLPSALAERQVGYAPWAATAGALADADAVLDLSATSPAGAWTSLAAAMAQTPLVGTPALGALPATVDALVARAEDGRTLRSEVVALLHQPELVARTGLLLQRAVLEGHTAAHRVREIAAAAGLDVPAAAAPTVSAVVPTNRVHELDNVFANLGRQAHPAVELVLVLHGLDTDDTDLRRRAAEAGVAHLSIVHADADLTLGACMNLGVDAASGDYVAKMDDDNVYGPHYLGDLLSSFATTDAGIVGKWAHYVWLRSTGAVVLRYPDAEHRYERRVQGGSMLFAGDVVRDVRFGDLPRAVDSDILDRAAAAGVRIFSGDRYNYVSVRGTDTSAHTWTVGDATFLTATGRLLFYGDPTQHVSL